MTASLHSIEPAVHLSLSVDDGQYTVSLSDTGLFVFRQQAQGQSLIAFSFAVGEDVSVNFQLPHEQTFADHGALIELCNVLHQVHTGTNLPPRADFLVRVTEEMAGGTIDSLSTE